MSNSYVDIFLSDLLKSQLFTRLGHGTEDINSFLKMRFSASHGKNCAVHEDRSITISRIFDDVAKILSRLENLGLRCVVTENASVLLKYNTCFGCFDSGDIDILYSNSYSNSKAKIECEMLSNGWFQVKRRKARFDSLVTFTKNFGTTRFYLNFDSQPISRFYYPFKNKLSARFDIDDDAKLERTSSGLLIFREELNLYHNLAHSAVGHFFFCSPGLRLLLEPYVILSNSNIKVSDIREMAIEDNLIIAVDYQLDVLSKLNKSLLGDQYKYASTASKHATTLNRFTPTGSLWKRIIFNPNLVIVQSVIESTWSRIPVYKNLFKRFFSGS